MSSNVWLTSDLHLGHRLVAGLRMDTDKGSVDLDDYHEMIVDTWNAHVGPGDTVWNLGDVTLGPIDRVGHVLSRLNNDQHHLVAGNHDGVHPMLRQAHREQSKWWVHFDSVQAFARRRINGQSVLLSHFPYTGEGDRPGPDRYTQYRLPNEGLPLLHGHTHDWRVVTEGGGARQVHVGWDAWGRPVNLDEIAELLEDQ